MPEKRWPKHRYRWRRAALEALRTTGSFTMAAAACGVSRRSLFRLRQADPRFEAEVENALDAYCDHLEELVDQRAFHGADDNPTPMAARWEPSGGSPEGLTPARGKGEGDPGAGPRRS